MKIMTMNKVMMWTAAAALGMGTLACESTITGKSGNLQFSYATVDDFMDFNKPIAVGARLDLKVAEVGTRNTVLLESADSDKPDVLAIHQYANDTVVLEGKSAGQAEISVTAKVPSGDVVEDGVDFQVAVPEVLKMKHHCSGEVEGHYLVDHEVWIPFDMELSNGRAVIGYGYHPIDIEPAGAAQLDATTKDQRHFRLKLADQVQTITLSSQIDAANLILNVIEDTQIDGVISATSGSVTTTVGGTSFLRVLPTIGEKPVCQANTPLTLTTSTPDVCTVSASVPPEELSIGVFNERGYISITGVNPGTCEITATYTAANDGQGASIELTAEVQ